MSGPIGVRIPGRKTVEAEYAEAVLEQAGWSLDGALEELAGRTIALMASGRRIKEGLLKAIDIGIEIQEAYERHRERERNGRSIDEFLEAHPDILRRA